MLTHPLALRIVKGSSAMSIYTARDHLLALNSNNKNQNIKSKGGYISKYGEELINILKFANLEFNDDTLLETKWRLLNLDFKEKLCNRCGVNVKFISMYKGFRQYCSKSCASLHRDNETRKGWVTKEGWDKSRETLYNLYNVSHQMHIADVHERQQAARYKTYSIYSPSGKEYRVQGYERYVIPILWEKYQENGIIANKSDLPKIMYKFNGKEKKYYPDAYIKSTNTIVEVKSTFTIKSELLIPKLNSCISLGYNIHVYLYNKGKITILSVDDIKNYIGSNES